MNIWNFVDNQNELKLNITIIVNYNSKYMLAANIRKLMITRIKYRQLFHIIDIVNYN